MYIDITDTSRKKLVGRKYTTESNLKINSMIIYPKVGEHKLTADIYTDNKDTCSVLSRWSSHQELTDDGYRFIIPAGLIHVREGN